MNFMQFFNVFYGTIMEKHLLDIARGQSKTQEGSALIYAQNELPHKCLAIAAIKNRPLPCTTDHRKSG